MDFAAPLQGDVVIIEDKEMIALGRASGDPVILPIGRGAIALGNDLTVLAIRSSQGLIVEFQTSNGAVITHTYLLEAEGSRLRIRTHVSGGHISVPSGLDLQRVYNRAQVATSP